MDGDSGRQDRMVGDLLHHSLSTHWWTQEKHSTGKGGQGLMASRHQLYHFPLCCSCPYLFCGQADHGKICSEKNKLHSTINKNPHHRLSFSRSQVLSLTAAAIA